MPPSGQPFRQNNNPPSGFRQGYQQQQPNRDFQPQQRAYIGEGKQDEENSPPDQEGYQGDYYDDQELDYAGQEDAPYHDDVPADNQLPAEESHSYFVGTPAKQARVYICQRCSAEFYSNNKLHKHIRMCKKESAPARNDAPAVDVFHASVIHSDASPDSTPGLGFRSWRYATFAASIGKPDSLHEICSDTGCGASLVDRAFLAEEVPDYQQRVQKKPDAMRVRGLGDSLLITTEHLPINFRIPGRAVDGSPAIACFTRHVYIVEGLKAKMLVGNDILGPELMVPDVSREKLSIGSCKDLTVKLNVKNVGPPVKRAVRSSNATKVPARSSTTIPFKLRGKESLPAGRDFMFMSQRIDRLGVAGGVLSHIVDAQTAVVQVLNATAEDVYIPKNSKLGIIQDYEEEGCFLASPKDAGLAANSGSHTPAPPAPKNWFKKAMKAGVAALAAGSIAYQAIAKPVISSATKETHHSGRDYHLRWDTCDPDSASWRSRVLPPAVARRRFYRTHPARRMDAHKTSARRQGRSS